MEGVGLNGSGPGLLEVGSCSVEMLLGMLSAGRLLCHREEYRYGRTYGTGPLG